jgi:hypothetical protein
MSWILLDRINESMLIGINEDNDQCKDNAWSIFIGMLLNWRRSSRWWWDIDVMKNDSIARVIGLGSDSSSIDSYRHVSGYVPSWCRAVWIDDGKICWCVRCRMQKYCCADIQMYIVSPKVIGLGSDTSSIDSYRHAAGYVPSWCRAVQIDDGKICWRVRCQMQKYRYPDVYCESQIQWRLIIPFGVPKTSRRQDGSKSYVESSRRPSPQE